MRKTFSFIGISVVLLLFAANLAFAGSSHIPDINETTWMGDITFVNTAGETAVLTDATLTVTAQTDNFFSATLMPDPANPTDLTTSVSFSGIIGPFRAFNPFPVQMTAPGKVVFGELKVRWWNHGRLDSPAEHERQTTLVLQGSDTVDGSTFRGTMIKQAPADEGNGS
jgi:hypothetical protein